MQSIMLPLLTLASLMALATLPVQQQDDPIALVQLHHKQR
jgi:hypothetical protein